ncbi:hypothetical protein [Alkalilimnicola ehrlichii]|uniref:hypothetical protein n=1 Tax=Alkalilimnicola ehrlichii TaxID=351052 RepID=UPI003BA3DEE0
MDNRLAVSLLVLRVSIFVVMLFWTLHKLLAPEAAAGIFESFYYIEGMSEIAMYAVGITQLVIEIAFVLGLFRFWTYGFVLLTHGISTLSSWQQYLDPFNNMLFLAAIPMLGACWVLFMLRDQDRLLTLGRP